MDRQSQYYKFMKELTTMTRSGKVKHDDAPDGISLFENEMRSGTVAKAEAAINPFMRRGIKNDDKGIFRADKQIESDDRQ